MEFVKRLSKWSFYLALLGSVVGIGAWQGWSWWSWASGPPGAGAGAKEVQIRIAPGTASQQIGQELETAGLIRSSTAWKLWARWLSHRDPGGGFKAGTYSLSPGLSLPETAAKIWTGDVVKLQYTIPEGWSLAKMAAYFENLGFFKAADFLAASRQIPQSKFPWLPTGLPHLEGFLYPDTYLIAGDSLSPEGVIEQMLRQFESKALPIYQQQQKQTQLSLRDWVTLASIVEKEAVVAAERGKIAGVFTRRLQLGMTLGSDPTVEYGLGITQTPDKPLTYAQVGTPNPYNTYINAGLPPGPIASPGIESLKATLNPETTEYLYFVARYDGTHIFSRTLAEHEAATGKIRDQRESQKPVN